MFTKNIIIILFILFTQQLLYSQDGYPEWELIDSSGYSSNTNMQIAINSKNQLIGLLPTGVFKSTDQGNKWTKLNTPDSLTYDIFSTFIVKDNIIFFYGYNWNSIGYNIWDNSKRYIIISYDYGETFKVLNNITDNYSEYTKTILDYIDANNNFWGLGVREKEDGKLYSVLIKADINTKIISNGIESYGESTMNDYMYIQDSLFLYFILKDTVINEHSMNNLRDISILYVYESDDYGNTWNTWNTFNPDGDNIPYYEFNKRAISLNWLFYNNGAIYFVEGNPNNEEDNRYFAINIKNKKFGYEKLHDFYRRGPLTKLNDSLIIAACGYTFGEQYNFYSSEDGMKTWNKITYNLPGVWWSQIILDSNGNIFTQQDEGVWRLMKGEKEWTLQNNGLQYLSGAYITINSKSEVYSNFFTYDNSKIYNPEQKIWINAKIDSCGIDYGQYHYHDFMENNDLLVRTYCGLKKWNPFTGTIDDILIEDSLKLDKIVYKDKNITYGHIYKYDNYGYFSNTYHAFSDDKTNSWQINHNFTNPGYADDYLYVFNKNKDMIVFADSGQIYLSHDRGTSWKKVLNDTANPKLYDSWTDQTFDLAYYCAINTFSGVGYVVYCNRYGHETIIYLTTDNGYTWKDISDIDSIKKMIFLESQWRNIYYVQNAKLIPDNSNGYFYASTPCGIYRSTDSLKSFHCITNGKIEPSGIMEVVLGNDGRLYAVQMRGIWRTKTKVTNSVDEVENTTKRKDLAIYPNPAGDYIVVNIDSINPTLKRGVDRVVDIQIFDMLGVVVSDYKGNPTPTLPVGEGVRIDVAFLTPGVYFIKIGNRVEKFVKM